MQNVILNRTQLGGYICTVVWPECSLLESACVILSIFCTVLNAWGFRLFVTLATINVDPVGIAVSYCSFDAPRNSLSVYCVIINC